MVRLLVAAALAIAPDHLAALGGVGIRQQARRIVDIGWGEGSKGGVHSPQQYHCRWKDP